MIYDINTIYLLCIGQGRAQDIHWSGSCPGYTLVRVMHRLYIGQGCMIITITATKIGLYNILGHKKAIKKSSMIFQFYSH